MGNHQHETRYMLLLDALRRMQELAGITLKQASNIDSDNPFRALVDIMMEKATRESNGAYLVFSKNDNVNINGYTMINGAKGITYAFDAKRVPFDPDNHVDNMTVTDAIVFADSLKTTCNGKYLLFHYDLLATYSNPVLDLDKTWTFLDGILDECRSVVVDIENLSIASLPFYKFHNLDECQSYSFDQVEKAITSANGNITITEKLDGSMIQMRYLENEDTANGAFENGLLFSTSNTLAGCNGSNKNDHLRALKKFYLTGHELNKYLDACRDNATKTLLFEFVRPDYDPHVVTYPRERYGLYLIGARDVSTGLLTTHEELVNIANKHNIPYASIVASSLDSALDLKANGNGQTMEGMVVNIDGWLVKIKLDSFLTLSRVYHQFEGNSFRSICEAMYEESLDDFLPKLPQSRRDYINAIMERLHRYNDLYSQIIADTYANIMTRIGTPPDDIESPEYRAWRGEYASIVATCLPSMLRGDMFRKLDGQDQKIHWVNISGGQPNYMSIEEFERRESILEQFIKACKD